MSQMVCLALLKGPLHTSLGALIHAEQLVTTAAVSSAPQLQQRCVRMDKRGPKLGDAASLWNFTPSPGWTKEESLILKLCLMKFGIGQWVQIQATGLLPGKLIQQLSGATQRLFGQQSLAAFSGLRVDIDRIRADNAAKTDAKRKSGLIIWGGANPTKEMRLQWQQEAKEKYGLTPEQEQEAETAYEQMVAAVEAARAAAAAEQQQPLPPDCNIVECDITQLTTLQKQQLLCLLHKRLQQLVAAAVQAQPQLQQQLAYQQHQGRGWIALGTPLQQAARAGIETAHGSKENVPSCANLVVRQAGRGAKGAAAASGSAAAAAAAAAAGKAGRGGGNSKAGRPPISSKSSMAGKKRGRKAEAAADDEADDCEFMQRRPRASSSGSRRGSNGSNDGSSSSMLADLMKVALDAGVSQLMEMGYSRSKALDALKECNCDVELAVEYLTAACC